MKPESFACMLEYQAATRCKNYEWMVTVFQLKYGRREMPIQNVEPLPPTFAFMLELRSLEAQRFIEDTDTAAA